MVGVDVLAAAPVPDDYPTHEEFVKAQMEDPDLGPVRKFLESKSSPRILYWLRGWSSCKGIAKGRKSPLPTYRVS